ncbi:MAG: hypothetical protein O7C75_04960 [Verrucomicrobia bacterium]|nr:hypothetical protein [Verrucomicrobiota bacterium]
MELDTSQRIVDESTTKTACQEQVDPAFSDDHSKADGHGVLLVLDVPTWDNERSARALSALLAGERGREFPLQVMAFIDGGLEDLKQQIQNLWEGRVIMVGVSGYLDLVSSKVRQNACVFTADVRERLEEIASRVCGPTWARRFGELWWYTELSEKNSAAVPPWWELLRLEAVRARLEEDRYGECIYFGSKGMIGPLGQLCNSLGVEFTSKVMHLHRKSLGWFLVLRAVSAAFLSFASLLGRLVPCRDLGTKNLSRGEEGRTFAFTYFPRSWTEGKEWMDRYYGRLLIGLDKQEPGPIYILALLDHLNFMTFRMAWARYRLLRGDDLSPQRYLVLEAYTSIREIFRLHLSPVDIFQYLKMRRHPDFRMAFRWHGLDVSNLTEPRILRSVAFDWPHLQVLERCAERVNKIGSPAVSWLYFFEYGTGRALIRGLKAGGKGKVFGLQHGPITPMKFIYAADMRDRRSSPLGGPPIPEPDLYIAEGSLARRILEESGVPSDRIVIAGAFQTERFWSRSRESRHRERFLGEPVRVLVGLGLHDFGFILRLVWEGLTNDSALHIVFKPHPKTSLDMLPPWFKVHKGAKVSVAQSNEDIYALLEGADVLVGTYSSVVLEAVAFGLPIILLRSNRIPDLSLFFSYDSLVLTASDGRTLRRQVDRLIYDVNFRDHYLRRLQTVVSDVSGKRDLSGAEHLAALYHDT